MWLVGVRDLQYRRRRFLIAVVATSVVFAMTVLMSGLSNGLDAEVDRIVASFQADSWVVADGASGPFTASKFISAADVERVRGSDGVQAAAPMLVSRATIGTEHAQGREPDRLPARRDRRSCHHRGHAGPRAGRGGGRRPPGGRGR